MESGQFQAIFQHHPLCLKGRAAPRDQISPLRRHVLRELFAPLDALMAPAAFLAAGSDRVSAEVSLPVIVLPGYGAGDLSTAPLWVYLRRSGYHAEGWGLGVNRGGAGMINSLDELSDRWDIDRTRPHSGEGEVPALCDRFIDHVLERRAELGRPVVLIGWSLGGMVAREAARELPDDVAAVITLGAPVNGGPKHTTVAPLFKARKMDLDWIETSIEDRAVNPITQPITAVYSKSDGIVSEYAALDTQNANVRHVEVSVSHLAMAVSAEVWGIIKGALECANESHAPH